MSITVLDDIPLSLDAGELAGRLKVEGLAGCADQVSELAAQAERIGGLRACFRLCEVEEKSGRAVVIGGQEFDSRILRVNLEKSLRVGLFVATCGVKLEHWAESFEDFLLRWLADEICEEALRVSARALESRLDPLIGEGYLASMNPGSLEDWPLTQQGALFAALGDVRAAVEVQLTESFLMRPRKSLSGVRFSSPEPFASCQLCPRPDCRGRRMPFDQGLFEHRYSGARHGGLYAESCACGRTLSLIEKCQY